MEINESLFRKYDIRGRASGENPPLDVTAARAIGLGFATYLQRLESVNTVVVGRDNRLSSYMLSRALMEGLSAGGCHVIDLEMVATPVVYWNAVTRDNIGGVMVTGSHLPPDQNGMKLCVGSHNIFGSQLKLIRRFIESGDLTYGQGTIQSDRSSFIMYVKDIAARILMERPLKVVVDAGNGTAGLFIKPLLQKWGHTLEACLFCQPDGHFPNHAANPQDELTLQELAKKVCDTGADIGIAFDGDSDRIGIVDELGNIISADRILSIFAIDLLQRHPGATILGDVLTSQTFFDVVDQYGGKSLMWASGHALVKAKMVEVNALLGGEMSGHIFWSEDYFGFDDGFFAAGRILQILSRSDKSLSELDAALPRYFSTPEYRPHCPEADKFDIVERAKTFLVDQGEIVDVDGIRVQFEDGWGLLRASNTEPVLSLRFEAKTQEQAFAYRDIFAKVLRQFPQVERFSDS